MIEIRHTKDTRPSYDQMYMGEEIHQMDSFFIWVCKLLELRPGISLLDISTGRGQMVEYAGKCGTNPFGIDFSMVACRLAAERSPGTIAVADGQQLPFPDHSFDAVTNLGSLEHFEHMDLGIREMVRVLKPEGTALLTVPNTFGLRWNIAINQKTGDVDDDGQPLQRYGTRRQWESLLTENGLAIQRVLGYEHERAFPRTRRDFFSYLRHPKRLFSKMLVVPLIPVNLAGQFVFICKPRAGSGAT
ncbi:MAG: class I SAM-dependent methyltransferase [Chloroflexi bacterium]|nr:class I SAM-dependent methyltransferase [Chloroflexota bacterium]